MIKIISLGCLKINKFITAFDYFDVTKIVNNYSVQYSIQNNNCRPTKQQNKYCGLFLVTKVISLGCIDKNNGITILYHLGVTKTVNKYSGCVFRAKMQNNNFRATNQQNKYCGGNFNILLLTAAPPSPPGQSTGCS